MANKLEAAPLEALDFAFEQPCEHSQHASRHAGNEPAMFLVRFGCPHCPRAGLLFLCLPGWERVGRVGLCCTGCRTPLTRDDMWTIVRVLGGPRS